MKRPAKVLIGVGVALLVATVGWSPLVVPRLVKLPGDINRTDHYSGTFVTFVDQSSGATLASPLVVPLTIDRHVASVPGATTAHVSLLHETITAHMGANTVVQQNVYAVDRRSMQNIADPRAWTFTPGNVVDRSGTYYLTLAMGVHPTGVSIKVWKPEAGASYPVTSTTPAKGVAASSRVVYLKGNIPSPLPVPPYEAAALTAQGLPMQLSPAQAGARLAAAGVNTAALLPVLARTLSAQELAPVSAAVTAPVALHYFVYGHGLLAVEPTTGGLVQLSGIVDGIAVQPDTRAISTALTVLTRHQNVPAIASLVTTLEQTVAAPPQPVYELRYTQTPASVVAAASYAHAQAGRVTLATTTLPRVLLALAVLSLLVDRLGRRGDRLLERLDERGDGGHVLVAAEHRQGRGDRSRVRLDGDPVDDA